MELRRRDFLFALSALALRPPEGLFGGMATAPLEQVAAWRKDESEVLALLCEQIVPEDDFPGARSLGVPGYIRRLLEEGHSAWKQVYHEGLSATERSSRSLYGRSFRELSFEEQNSLLEKMERSDLRLEDWGALPAGEFFAMVRSHTMQGYYGHPRWGGNRDKKAWEMIGYEDWWV